MSDQLPFGILGALFIFVCIFMFRVPFGIIRNPFNQFKVLERLVLERVKMVWFKLGLVYAVIFSTYAALKGEYLFIGLLLLFLIVSISLFLAAREVNKP